MKKTLCLFFISWSSFLFAQDFPQYTSSISKEDSLTIISMRNKMATLINQNPDSAFYFSKRIKDFNTQKKYGQGIADADYLIGVCLKRMQQNDSAIFYFKNSLKLSEKIEYDLGIARAYNSLCRTYYVMGEMEASVIACEKALTHTNTDSPANTLVFADTHIALATAYARQNKLQEAIKNLFTVDSIHKIEPLRPDVIAAAYQNLGGIYLDLKEYDAAENYYILANNEFIKLPANASSYYLNTTHINLGRVYFFKGNLVKADSLLTLSHTFFSEIKDERTIGEISTYLGQLKVKEDQLLEAEEFFKQGFAIHKKNQRDYEASLNALELAKLALKKGDSEKALSYLRESLTLNQSSKNSLVSQETYELLARTYSRKGEYKNAFLYAESASRLKDSLQEIQSSDKIKEIEAIYQTESRDREIALLTSNNELVQEQKRNQRNVLLGGIGIVGLTGLFFFFQYRNRIAINNKLQELDKAKSAFFANISHEFRTPLTLIKGPLEDQISNPELKLENRKNLLIAQRNVNRLENLVEQLLALSKLESGHFKLQLEPGNLSNFIATQIESYRFGCLEKGIELRLDVPQHEQTDWFDQDALEKIISNLIGNAIKFTPEGGIIIVCGVSVEERYTLKVKNSGIFISKEDQKRLFERFYKANSKFTGTGIGLALTKELTELHHGTIDVVNHPDGFLEFIVDIPVSKLAFDASEIISEESRGIDPISTFSSAEIKESIIVSEEESPIMLIVDDAPDIRNYVKSIFETTYNVHTASDGKEGFELALQLIPDIIISDVMMPIDDGFTLTKNLKQNELTSHIPVILLTAKSEVTDKLEGLEIGADSYMTKPFSSRLVKATAENLIENRRKLQQRFSQEVILRPKEIAFSSADEQFLERLQKVMDEQLDNADFNIEMFSGEMAVSRMQLHRKLKAISGQSAGEFLKTQRLKTAIRLLKEDKISISEVGYAVGFNDPSYFTRCFKQEYGCSPSEFLLK